MSEDKQWYNVYMKNKRKKSKKGRVIKKLNEDSKMKTFTTQILKDEAIQARKDAFAELDNASVAEKEAYDTELAELKNARVTG